MSTYNDNRFKKYLNTARKKTNEYFEEKNSECQEEDMNFRNIFNTLCKTYTEYFPERKIYITRKLGKRLSYLTGSGKELYLKPVEIPIQDNFIVFIESNSKVSLKEKGKLKDLFSSIISNLLKEVDSSE